MESLVMNEISLNHDLIDSFLQTMRNPSEYHVLDTIDSIINASKSEKKVEA
jgi:hypothetical protein